MKPDPFWKPGSLELLLYFNTHRMEHGNSTLFNHLIETKFLLQSWGASEDVYHAGLFHSIYDTEYYKGFSWSDKEKDRLHNDLVRIIGPRSERLVRLFGTICNIMVANLIDQIKSMPDHYTFGSSGIVGDTNLVKEMLKLKPHLHFQANDDLSKFLIRRIPYSPEEGFESPIVYKNFWSNKVLDKLNEKIRAYGNEIPVKVQYNQWAHGVIEDSGPVLIYSLNDDKELVENIKKELDVIYDTSTLEGFDCSLHIFYRGSYIPWHDDHRTFVCNTYLNDARWDWNWGGALLYQDKNGKTCFEFPKYNKMFVQSGQFNIKNNMHHGTSILSPASIPKITLQIFAKSKGD